MMRGDFVWKIICCQVSNNKFKFSCLGSGQLTEYPPLELPTLSDPPIFRIYSSEKKWTNNTEQITTYTSTTETYDQIIYAA